MFVTLHLSNQINLSVPLRDLVAYLSRPPGGFDAGIWRRPDRSLCGWMGFAQSLATWNTFTRWKQCAPIAKTSITTAKVRLSRCSPSSHVDPSCAPQRRTRQPDRKFFAQDFAPESKQLCRSAAADGRRPADRFNEVCIHDKAAEVLLVQVRAT